MAKVWTSSAADAIARGVQGQALDRRRLSEQITASLEELIVTGEIKPGERLPSERELMSLFGVGRTSVREALFALQRKGAVTAQPGLRPVVCAPRPEALVAELSTAVGLFLQTEAGIREFQRARRVFEPAVARFAATHATAEDRARMARALAACEAARRKPEGFVDADVDFHFAIVQATHSELLIALHRAVLDWLREQRVSSIRPTGSIDAAQRAHRRVLDAILAKDPDRAEQAMLDHLSEVERYYWEARPTPRQVPRARQSGRTSKTPAKRRSSA